MRRDTFFASALAAAAASSLPLRGFARSQAGQVNLLSSTTVPISLVDNTIYIEAYFGKKPYIFSFDTAAVGGTLSNEAGVALDLFPVGEASLSGAHGPVRAEVVVVKSFRIGSAIQNDASFAVAPPGFFGPKAPVTGWKHPFGGVFGLAFYKHLATSIDYGMRTLTFALPNAFRLGAADVALPLQLREGAIPNTKLGIGDAVGHFDIDSGSKTGLVLNPSFAQKHGFNAQSKPAVKVGGVVIPNAAITIAAKDTGFMHGSSDFAGTAGGAFLKNFVVTLDVDDSRIYFRKAGT